jgi:flagellar basal body-associated protein FliL
MHNSKSSKLVPVVLIICATIVALAALGTFIYTNQQNSAIENKKLEQQKLLSEEENQSREKAAKIKADGDARAARCAQGDGSFFSC